MEDKDLVRDMSRFIEKGLDVDNPTKCLYAKDEYYNHQRKFKDPRTGKIWTDITTDIARF